MTIQLLWMMKLPQVLVTKSCPPSSFKAADVFCVPKTSNLTIMNWMEKLYAVWVSEEANGFGSSEESVIAFKDRIEILTSSRNETVHGIDFNSAKTNSDSSSCHLNWNCRCLMTRCYLRACKQLDTWGTWIFHEHGYAHTERLSIDFHALLVICFISKLINCANNWPSRGKFSNAYGILKGRVVL